MMKWVTELGEYVILYKSQIALKGQVLVDFIFKLCYIRESPKDELSTQWVMFIDGFANKSKGGVGIILRSPKQIKVLQAIQFEYLILNNDAEYETLVVKLHLAPSLSTI